MGIDLLAALIYRFAHQLSVLGRYLTGKPQ
jgi:hypothetical protein